MKPFVFYENAGPYPQRNDYYRYYVYSKGKIIVNGEKVVTQEQRAEWDRLKYTVEKEFLEDLFKADTKSYSDRRAGLDALFKEDLFDDLGIADHPKRQILYQIAYDNAHSEGYSVIYDEAETLSDLLR